MEAIVGFHLSRPANFKRGRARLEKCHFLGEMTGLPFAIWSSPCVVVQQPVAACSTFSADPFSAGDEGMPIDPKH